MNHTLTPYGHLAAKYDSLKASHDALLAAVQTALTYHPVAGEEAWHRTVTVLQAALKLAKGDDA